MSKPRAVGTRVAVLFAGWLASSGTIVANAHEECFIANPVKTEVLCHPVVVAP